MTYYCTNCEKTAKDCECKGSISKGASCSNDLLCCCEHCDNGAGDCMFPSYGIAPHKHVGAQMIGSTVIDDKNEWPANFQEDCEAQGCGIWTHCMHCGRPNNEKLWYQDQDTKRLRKIKAT